MEIDLYSNRLKLRLIDLPDLEEIHILHSLPETDQFNTLGMPANIDETKSVILKWIADNKMPDIRNYTFAVINNQSEKFTGLLGLKLWPEKNKRGEIWYKIHPDFWNKGIATEAANLILDFGFDTLNLHRIQAGCATENVGSIKVLEKVGMFREGRGRQILPLKSGWADNYEYSILESDDRQSRK